MSLYGEHWKIDDVTVGMIQRGSENGCYRVISEREYAELPQIEAISWQQPVIEHLRPEVPDEMGLPEGYGFAVERITYDSATRSYTVELKTARQYLGDVADYQAQVEELTVSLSAKEQEAAELRETVAAKEAAIEAQSQKLAALKEDGTAAAEAQLQAAYTEGVESNG